MSSLNSNDDCIKIFVYGTLKKEEPNNEELSSRNASFVCDAVTVHKWPLIVASDLNLPFMLNKKDHGKNVFGNVYLINNETKKFLDFFEGVEDELYSIFEIDVKDVETHELHTVSAYLLDDFKESLLNENTYYFENYSSRNEIFGEYKKSEDTPENTKNLLKQIKKNFN